MDLIADIGGTHTRCALIGPDGRIAAPESLKNTEFSGVDDVLRNYLKNRRVTDRPDRAALAVAAPIINDHIEMTNLEWNFSKISLQSAIEVRRLEILNDFEALAWGLADFGPGDREQIGDGAPDLGAAIAVVGPGSGLGVGALVPHQDGWVAVPGEGGHVTLAATTPKEERLVARLRETFGHCSAERVLSGPGLVNLYVALSEIAGQGTPSATPAKVTELAQEGDRSAREAVAHFFAFLGTVASDVAVTLGARGGVYIAGGIIPRFVGTIHRSKFRERFEAKGRYRGYLEAIPTYVLTDPAPAFRGLRRVLGYD